MNLIESVRNWWNPPAPAQQRTLTRTDGELAGLCLEPSLAGVGVSNEKALTVSAFYTAVRHIAEAIASLPKGVAVRQPGGGKKMDLEHPVTFLLAHEPNSYMNAVDFWEWLVLQVLLFGNAYAKLDILNSGRVAALHPIQAAYMQVSWTVPTREVSYHVTDSNYTVAEDLSAYEVTHIHGLSVDAILGINPLDLWRESMATSIALERYSASFFGQGCRPSGVLKHMGMLSDKARQNLKESWKRTYSGTANTGAVPLLEEGLEFVPMSASNDEFQMIESKQLQTRAMANWAKISPTKCGDLSRATWSNLEQENQSFISDTLAPLIHKIEQEFSRKCLLPGERATHCVEFDVTGLLKGDSRTRYANHQSALTAGWKTVNEVRLEEGLEPIEGGDVLRTPLNLGAADDPAPDDKPDDQQEDKPTETPVGDAT